MLSYFTITTCSELVCFFLAFYSLRNDKKPAWKGLAFYMLLVCFVEFLGVYIKLPGRKHNSWIYNILLIFETGIVALMFQMIMAKYIKTRPIIISSVILLAGAYIFDLSTSGFFAKAYYTNITLGILVVLVSLFYFYYLLKDEDYVDLKYAAEFWWVFGAFFYYFGATTLNVFYPVLATMIMKHKDTFYYIYQSLNLIQYACWSYSFLCRKKTTIVSVAL